MKHRKNLLKDEISQLEKDFISLSEIDGKMIFEINDVVTNDIAEAVSILMKIVDNDDSIWDVDIKTNGLNIKPENSLFLLSGGDEEWNTLMNYNKHWSKCYTDFQDEFGMLVINGVKNSRKMRDLRDYFNKYLSLPIMYNFAIKKRLIN
jgi:hypothetical protein